MRARRGVNTDLAAYVLWYTGWPMRVLRVRHHEASIDVGFRLGRFITDWPAAQQKFIGGIADGFLGWVQLGPQDFTVNPAAALEDLRCTCRLFNGAGRIVLAPDALRLHLTSVPPDGRAVVLEAARKVSRWFADALGDRGLDLLSYAAAAHLKALEDEAADPYLDQFLPASVAELTQAEPGARYHRSGRVVLSSGDGWMLRRNVEKSARVKNGVFVETTVDIRPDDADSEAQLELLERLERLADRAVGLQCEDSR